MTLIPLHVTGGAIGILSGLIALYALKGAQLQRTSGTAATELPAAILASPHPEQSE